MFSEKLDKRMTNVVKGVALILMFIHHFYGYPQWLIEGISIPEFDFLGYDISVWVGCATQLTVDMFAFMTGWGYFHVKEKDYKYSFRKIISFLKVYWIQLGLFFIPLTIFYGNKLSLSEVAMSIFAVNESNNVVMFAWYVFVYVLLMLTLPIVVKTLFNKPLLDFTVPLIVCHLLFYATYLLDGNYYFVFHNYVYYLELAIVGYLLNNYKVFDKIPFKLDNIVVNSILFLGILFIRGYTSIISLRVNVALILVPLLIYLTVQIVSKLDLKSRKVSHILMRLGEHSLNMWFIHSMAFNPYLSPVFQSLFYLPKNPILVIIFSLIFCYSLSLNFNNLSNSLNLYFEKIIVPKRKGCGKH